MVPCSINLARNSALDVPQISCDAADVRFSNLTHLPLCSIRTINRETHPRFAKSVQDARLASGLDGCASLPTHNFATTTDNLRLLSLKYKLVIFTERVIRKTDGSGCRGDLPTAWLNN